MLLSTTLYAEVYVYLLKHAGAGDNFSMLKLFGAQLTQTYSMIYASD